MHVKYTRLSTQKINKILHFFCKDLSATQIARLVGVQRKTIDNWFKTFRTILAKFHGISRKCFYYHLKECEFCYNKKHGMLKVFSARLREILV